MSTQQEQTGPVTIIDTREQTPLSFSLPTERGTLTTGDYSIKGLERYIAIERKSIDDLTGSLQGQNRERFERELSRGRGLEYFALAIEADLAEIAGGGYRSKMNPRSVVQSLFAFSVRYNLPSFLLPWPGVCGPGGGKPAIASMSGRLRRGGRRLHEKRTRIEEICFRDRPLNPLRE